MSNEVYFGLGLFLYSFFIHDIVVKSIYCKWKHKHKTKKRCYFWNCKKYHDCPLNYSNVDK